MSCAPNTPGAVREGNLAGQSVSFTGRLASLSRGEAERLVRSAGGRVSAGITASTTMLVVGMDGWPLLSSGRLTRKLAAAEQRRSRGESIAITTERAFRETLGLEPAPVLETKPLDGNVAASAAGVDERMLERWEQLGLVRSSAGRYDFRDLVSLRTLAGLVAQGVNPVVIRRSLEGLSDVLPGVDRPLAQLNVIERGGRVVAEIEGTLVGPEGQLELRFDPPPAPSTTAVVRLREDRGAAADWIESGLSAEQTGDLAGAERAYRSAIAADPSEPAAHFNLANVLVAQGRLASAVERFLQATALDPWYSRAWFNLAHAQDELGRPRAALRSLRRAIAVDPAYADAYFNLAVLCNRLHRRAEETRAWRAYLSLDPHSEWAETARERLTREVL